MTERLKCYHLASFREAPQIEELVREGRLSMSNNDRGICDWKIPVPMDEVCGQDVACTGSCSPECPDPASAKIVDETASGNK